MATVTCELIVQGFHLQPGQTQSWIWNNALQNATYTFTVRPRDALANPALTYQAEILNVRYASTGGHESPIGDIVDDTLSVHFDVHNPGTTMINYWVVMTSITTV